MGRSIRRENPDAIYHVYSRGNYRAPIFADDKAAESFLRALEGTIRRAGWELYAYAIMPNHMQLGDIDGVSLIDGSVLVNAPFAEAMDVLRDRPAQREVDRRYWRSAPIRNAAAPLD